MMLQPEAMRFGDSLNTLLLRNLPAFDLDTGNDAARTNHNEFSQRFGVILIASGADVFVTDSSDAVDLKSVLAELGRRGCTNAMLEAGPGLLGSFFDQKLIDEVHVFIAPKLSGGVASPGPIGGLGVSTMFDASACDRVRSSTIGTDLLIQADCPV